MQASMMRQAHLGTSNLWLLLGIVAIASTTTGCELIAAVDRTEIGDGGASATGPRGILGGYQNGRIYGWAFIADQDEPVKVSIEVDGLEVGVPDADDPRSDLLDKGIHPTGDAGFHLDIEVESGVRIEAFLNPAGIHWELEGSPFDVP